MRATTFQHEINVQEGSTDNERHRQIYGKEMIIMLEFSLGSLISYKNLKKRKGKRKIFLRRV